MLHRSITLACAILALALPLQGQEFYAESDAMEPDGFFAPIELTLAVSPASDVVLRGEYKANVGGALSAGEVHVYRYNITTEEWDFEQTLTESPATFGNEFGQSVAFHGERVLIGAPLGGDGTIYTFEYDSDTESWDEIDSLTPDDTDANDFGVEMLVDGDRLVVSAPASTVGTTLFAGKVYVYEYNSTTDSWDEEAILEPEDPEAAPFMGQSLAVSGDVIVVGAPFRDTDDFNNAGGAYVFRRDAVTGDWSEEAVLTKEDPTAIDFYGSAVSIRDGVIAVGVPGDDTVFSGTGLVEVFTYDSTDESWDRDASIFTSNSIFPSGDAFGSNVQFLTDDTLLVAAKEGASPIIKGVAYLFGRDSETGSIIQLQRLAPEDSTTSDEFGWEAQRVGDQLFLGSLRENTFYVYDVFEDCNRNSESDADEIDSNPDFDCNDNDILDACESDCNGNGIHDDCDIDDGTSADCNGNGIPDECEEFESLELAGSEGDSFGASAVVTNRFAAIAAPDNSDFGTSNGAVYTYAFDEATAHWRPLGITYANVPDQGDHYATDIAMHGDLLVVGAHFARFALGSVYVNRYLEGLDRFGQVAELKPSVTGGVSGKFGTSVACSEEVIVVGAPEYDVDGLVNVGSVFVFRYDGTSWIEEAQLESGHGIAHDWFGIDVDISEDGSTIVVGAHRADFHATNAGAAYVFEYDETSETWSEALALPRIETLATPDFGARVAIDDDVIAVGVPAGHIAHVGDTGLVYLYRYHSDTQWLHEQTLSAPDPELFAAYGRDLEIQGSTLIVGASLDDAPSTNSGAVYLYRYVTASRRWVLERDLAPAAALAEYGSGVALSESHVLVGARGADEAVFLNLNADCNQNGLLDDCETITDCDDNEVDDSCDIFNQEAFDLNANGTPDSCDIADGDAEDCNENGIPDSAELDGEQKLAKDRPVSGQQFGSSIAITSGWAAVGNPTHNVQHQSDGSVSVYRYLADGQTWSETQTLLASDGETDEEFGTVLAIDGPVLVVGVPLESSASQTDRGAVYVFRRTDDTWFEEEKLTGSAAGDDFGESIALEGDRLVVGAPGADLVYVYEYDSESGTWEEVDELEAGEGDVDNFGEVVSLSGDTIAVGDPDADEDEFNSGTVYVYRLVGSTWEETIIRPSVITSAQNFGKGVAIEDDHLAVLARDDKIHMYEYSSVADTWTETVVLTPDHVAGLNAMALVENQLIAGSTTADATGRVAEFRYDEQAEAWFEIRDFGASDTVASDFFGGALAMSEGFIAVGATGVDSGTFSVGAAYVFTPATDCDDNGVPDDCDEDCDGDGRPDVCEIEDGSAVDCDDNGIPDSCEDLQSTPSITTGLSNSEVCEGELVTLAVTAEADLELSYEWTLNGETISGETSDTLEIESISPSASGVYEVTVSTTCASVSSDALVTVQALPLLDTPPIDMTVCEGDDATFEVTSSGLEPFSYQWQESDGEGGFIDVDGATSSSFTLLEVSDLSAAEYRVIVDNDCGSTTSDPATLTVNVVPEITATHAEVTGLTVAFSVDTTGADVTVTWEFGDDLTGEGVELEHTYTVSDSYTVEVTVTNDCGSDTASIEIQLGTEFLRGDCDNNGTVFPIIDALFLLEYGFNDGPEPECLASADADGNDSVFPIIDALYILEYGFKDGPAPPDPGPTTCGSDPNNIVSCDTGPDVCL